MHGTAARTRRRTPARLLLVLAALVGIVGMHALVLGVPTATATPRPHGHPGTGATGAHPVVAPPYADPAAATSAYATSTHGDPSPAGHAPGTDHAPADHSGLAHLCLALAAGIFLLLVRRTLLGSALAAPHAARTTVRAVVGRWVPPPDPVALLCVSRT